MRQLGHAITLFKALYETGGVLTFGIPEFRLPKSIVQFEISLLKEMGVRNETYLVIGNIHTIDELLEEFNAIFIGVGARLPTFMGIKNESLGNFFSANEFLTRMNLMKAYRYREYDTPMPKGNKVTLIGGGNVAMDCARTAIRTGADLCIISVGTGPNPIIFQTTPDLKRNKWGYIDVNIETLCICWGRHCYRICHSD